MTTDIVLAQPGERSDIQLRAAATVARFVNDNLVVPLQGKRYVTVAGATMIASACGYSVREVSSRYQPAQEPLPGFWEVEAEVLDLETGQVVGRGKGIVADDEPAWEKRPLFAKRAMASTRAAGRALRLCIGHLFVALGPGVQTVTLEEMPNGEPPAGGQHSPPPANPAEAKFVGQKKGKYPGVLSKVWPPREGKKGIGIEVTGVEGVAKFGIFDEGVMDDARELEGSDVEVSWTRSKDGKWLNADGILPTRRVQLEVDPESGVPF
jgi:hypothetical protein